MCHYCYELYKNSECGVASLCFPYDDEEYMMYVGANDLGLFLYANILTSQNFRCAGICVLLEWWNIR